MTTRLTKLQRLVQFLLASAQTSRTVTRSTIESRFRGDPSFVVYFNGLKRNGAIDSRTGKVYPSKISGALTKFRKVNRSHQEAYYARLEGISG